MSDVLTVLKERFSKEPYFKLLGLELLEIKKGHVKLQLKLKDDFLNSNGVVMGGVIVTLLDAASPYVAMTSKEEDSEVATIKMGVSFRAPALIEHRTLFAEAIVVSQDEKDGRKSMNIEACVYTPKNVCIAKSSSLFAVVPKSVLDRKLKEAREKIT